MSVSYAEFSLPASYAELSMLATKALPFECPSLLGLLAVASQFARFPLLDSNHFAMF